VVGQDAYQHAQSQNTCSALVHFYDRLTRSHNAYIKCIQC